MTPSGVEQMGREASEMAVECVNPTMTPSGVEQTGSNNSPRRFSSEPDDDAFGR